MGVLSCFGVLENTRQHRERATETEWGLSVTRIGVTLASSQSSALDLVVSMAPQALGTKRGPLLSLRIRSLSVALGYIIRVRWLGLTSVSQTTNSESTAEFPSVGLFACAQMRLAGRVLLGTCRPYRDLDFLYRAAFRRSGLLAGPDRAARWNAHRQIGRMEIKRRRMYSTSLSRAQPIFGQTAFKPTEFVERAA